jgi:hypothetical protein
MLLLLEAAQTAQSLSDKPAGLTTAGWIFMSIAWTTIISMAVFCYRKVLQKAAEKRQRALLEASPMNDRITEKRSTF